MNDQKKFRKIYGTKKPYTKGSHAFVYTNEKGAEVNAQLDFSKGRSMPGFVPGRFMTDDPLLQKAIESSKHFNRMYELLRSIPITTAPNVVNGQPATTGTLARSQDEPSTTVIELGKPTGNPAIDGYTQPPPPPLPQQSDPQDSLPEGFEISNEGISEVTSGVKARTWLLRNIPLIKASDLPNNTKIKEVAAKYDIEFPNWE